MTQNRNVLKKLAVPIKKLAAWGTAIRVFCDLLLYLKALGTWRNKLGSRSLRTWRNKGQDLGLRTRRNKLEARIT